MKKLFVITLMIISIFSLAACGDEKTPTDGPDSYPKFMGKLQDYPTGVSYEFYAWNDEADGKVYGIEYLPKDFDKESGDKLPIVICVHGAGGDELMLSSLAKELTGKNISAITFGCRGASDSTKSDDGSATVTSRASDLNTMLKYVQSLPWVDQDKIYFYGESMGGITIMLSAEYFQQYIAGIIITASGFTESQAGFADNEFPQYTIQDGQTWDQRLLAYTGDFIMFHATGDEIFSSELSKATYELYNTRDTGICEYYETEGGSHDALSTEGKALRIQVIEDYIFGHTNQ